MPPPVQPSPRQHCIPGSVFGPSSGHRTNESKTGGHPGATSRSTARIGALRLVFCAALGDEMTRPATIMKSFLAIVGVLAVFAAVLVLFASKSAVHEILSSISLLVGCSSLGLSKLIELVEDQKRIANESAKEQREAIINLMAAVRAPSARPLPPIPGLEQFYVVENAVPSGPFRRDQVQALRANGTLAADSWILIESGAHWQRYADVFC